MTEKTRYVISMAEQGYNTNEIAAVIGKDKRYVRQLCRRYGVKVRFPNMGPYYWTEERLELLRRQCLISRSWGEVAKPFDTTWQAVRTVAINHKFPRPLMPGHGGKRR